MTGSRLNEGGSRGDLEDAVLYLDSDYLGRGEEELGRVLMRSFLETLAASARKPRRILAVNRGVFLTTEGSEVIGALRRLEEVGVEVFSCGTCLDYYGRKDKLQVGNVGSMAGTVESLLTAGRVVGV